MEVTLTSGGIRAADAAGSVAVATEGWRSGDGAGSPGPVDEVVSGSTRTLSFLPSRVAAERLDGDATYHYDAGRTDGSVALPAGDYRVHVAGSLDVTVRFDGRGTLVGEHDAVALRFPRSTAVSVGFRSRQSDDGPLTVPRTVEGAATAVSWLGTGFLTTTPARSAPTMRGRPPRVTFGDATTVPSGLAERRPETDVEIVVPPELPYLFTVAPLATYLGADVRLGNRPPRLVLPDGVHEFRTFPGFQHDASDLLRRVFLLDCLVRESPGTSRSLAERRHLDAVGVDPASLADTGIAERVSRYLAAPFDRISADLPEWHLAMYLEPTADTLPTLPQILSDLPFVFLPQSSHLGGDERLSRSLDDFYRGLGPGPGPGPGQGPRKSPGTDPVDARRAPEVDAVKPVLGPGRLHGWLANNVPIDVFKSVPEAYEHRERRREGRRTTRPLSVVVVVNDTEMIDEYADLSSAYGRQVGDVGVDVEVHKRLTRRELADVFEAETDLVHYIGHCEAAGLRCTDGHLAVRSIRESNAEAFLLNACGSYYEGLDLVRKGSVAGAVTFNKVLDRHAARVGTTFVRLLLEGFSIERALGLARRRIIMGKDYAVVGDGTHAVRDSGDGEPADAVLERIDDGAVATDRANGSGEPTAADADRVRGADDGSRTVDRADAGGGRGTAASHTVSAGGDSERGAGPGDGGTTRGDRGGVADGAGTYRLTYRVHDARRFGAAHEPHPSVGTDAQLVGNERTVTLDADEVRRFLRTADVPVVHDGDIHWADELVERLDRSADGNDGSG